MSGSQDDLKRVESLLVWAGMGKDAARTAAQTLLARYGSLAPLFEAAPEDLAETGLVTPNGAALLHLIPQIAAYTARDEASSVRRADTFQKAAKVLRPLFIGSQVEKNGILCLDGDGTVLFSGILQEGTVDETPFYLRHVLEALLRCRAQAAVLCHNHPSFSPKPSRDDIETTRVCLNALADLGIAMPDHIIFAGRQAVSIRESGLISEAEFCRGSLCEPLMRGWLGGGT
ncbi:MAG: JAB domain-containing protein [Clostridia bacterium]|nr:JAB domain-containing protein [Clostridia bacterium]